MAKRRAPNGQGLIRQRQDGTWEGRYTMPGMSTPKSVYGKTQGEVRKKLTAATAALDEGIYFEPSKIKVGQWLDIWHGEYLGGVKPHTISQYGTQIKVHLTGIW